MKGYNLLSKFHFYKLDPLNIILVATLLFSFVCSVRVVYSAQVTLEWQASSGNVAGYNVYRGTSSRDYDVTLDVGNWTSVTIADLEDSEAYYFAVTAYDQEDNESGYSNEACINCASQGTTNKVVSGALDEVRRGLIRGQGLSKPMSRNAVFLPLMVQMANVGEGTGNLDQTLTTVAESYEMEADDRTTAAIGLIQPIMTVAIGLVVGFIALSLMSAMYSMYGQISG